jgi:dTDP-4-dehydrorhamnose 3,5-epimerase
LPACWTREERLTYADWVKFEPLTLQGAYLIHLDRLEDDRGFFARAWCEHELADQGLNTRIAQANVSFNKTKGTLRGMHYQAPPYAEVKLVRCTRGAIYDVIIDIRPDSQTFRRWLSVELNEDNHDTLYIPEGFAHGFQTLEDGAEVYYQHSEFYTPGAERGLRYNDPAFGIAWPLPVASINPRDESWPLFE